MANPYPPNQGMHGMQPMQQHPQQPMGQMPPQQMQQPQRPTPARSGTSRAVPVVVSAGLAVGVFCGLLFGVGIPEDATASPSTGNNVKAADPAEATPTPTASASTAIKPAATATTATPTTGTAAGSGSAAATASTPTTATTAATGSGSAATTSTKPAASAGSGSATPTVAATPALKKVKLIVEVKPDTVAATAKITVDRKDITGGMTELELPSDGKKEVKVVVKASGYKTIEQKVEIEGDVTVKVELIKRSGGGSTGGGTTPARPPTGGGKKKPPAGGLIDI
ncbi:MAG: hypothetical protein H0T42_24370 [Deltaproteobacteria bacterium]|nr:hypothetical protein [Deltaproteobacteria bacterium]